MNKIQLPSVTLLIADCVNVTRVEKVIDRCKGFCDFGAVKLLTSQPIESEYRIEIQPLNSLVDYSLFMLTKAHEYVDTEHVLVAQYDGWILNPQRWEDKWLNYDYIGALFNQQDVMGVGGFSFRSKRLMKAVADMYPQWNGDNAEALQKSVGLYEDGAIAMKHRRELESRGFKFATLEEAAKFSQGGNPNNNYYVPYPFGIHGGWRAVDIATGFVSPDIKNDGIVPEL